jgi:hypothetical protein
VTHEQGLVSVLKQIHDDLDAAVFDAYGWPRHLSDEAILERLVALNAERAAEEARGLVRWLRPEFQNPQGPSTAPTQANLSIVEGRDRAGRGPEGQGPREESPLARRPGRAGAGRPSGPRRPPRARHPRGTGEDLPEGRVARVAEVLNALESLGHARTLDAGRYARA